MDFQTISYRKTSRVAHITMRRPEVLNAMNSKMHEELSVVWNDFEADPETRVAVLSGTGDRAFSVGQDLKESGANTPTTFGSYGKPGWPRLTERFELSKPIIAKVRGYALGGGFELALACDIIVASTDAVFGLPEATLGLVPGAGGVFRLSRQLPWHTAMGLLMSGRSLAAPRAFGLGLINDVVPPDELDACVAGWIADIVRCSPLSVRAIKEAATRAEGRPLEAAFATRYRWEERRAASQDPIEGRLAFREKREPRWQEALPDDHQDHP
ncbi:enoyl-CoA-hydratase DpgD [Nocardia sputi]|uniref:enoyl-CoA-hydratase DpgD n=1 Tax=Nocardia sputi TaxID=2943705 RepID=UPI0020BDBB90|nr:enoyl-CoA-hydratase DpgD [Nocardia sputi]